jgi:hypothetical protein
MERQVRGWTCSAAATDWLLRATGLDPYSTREKVVAELGYPGCIDEYSGLKDSRCIQRVIEQYDVRARQEWVGWERALQLARSTALILNSTSWYHFVAVRGLTEIGDLWIANSAPLYQAVGEVITRRDWDRLPGWQAIYIVND